MKAPEWTIAHIAPQTGKIAVVTGANSGIGWHTALELARAGGEVILAARTEAKGRDAVERIRRELSQANVRAEVLDLASLRSVRAFAAKVSYEAKLDLLVNNAGVMSVPKRQVTEDGFELQFGTNFLGPFALTGLLMPVLQRSASPRVTTVSSTESDREDIPIEKIMASFMSQDAAHGALPTLRAATAMDAAHGSYYAPDRMFELKGRSSPCAGSEAGAG